MKKRDFDANIFDLTNKQLNCIKKISRKVNFDENSI